MEKRKASLVSQKICRFCLSQNNKLSSLYDRSRIPKKGIGLSMEILSSISVEVFPSDGMPPYICDDCRFFMGVTYQFKQICRQADESIMQFVQKGIPLEPVLWPAKLNKIFQSANTEAKPKEKTVINEDVSCIQVSSQEPDSDVDEEEDYEDDEDDDDEVYNIKIGDDGTEGGETTIKLLSGSDKGKSIQTISATKVSEKSHVQKEWPCVQCDSTFLEQKLLNTHVMLVHPAPTIPCPKCNKKFQSTDEMQKHLLLHSQNILYMCTICNKKFKTTLWLKRHEQNHHPDMPHLKCRSCDETYLSIKQLEAHEQLHYQLTDTIECNVCHETCPDHGDWRKHIEIKPGGVSTFICDYCPQRFKSGTALAKHVRNHGNEIEYPCKYCSKIFYKSHHYSRHLRLVHRTVGNSGRMPFGECEMYRCEQCEDSFVTQDELIYHSAIHTTQNLTCPLCHEKFENVDAVTMHVKSHIQGVQFKCSLCELVFTSKEKLETHLQIQHEDEISHDQGTELDEDSMEVDDDEENDSITVKKEGDHMIVQLNKSEDYMLASETAEEDGEDVMVEEINVPYNELLNKSAVITKSPSTTIIKQSSSAKQEGQQTTAAEVRKIRKDTVSILRKAAEIKLDKAQSNTVNEKPNERSETSNSTGTSDKSLKLLEKELQEWKRTSVKIPTKGEVIKGRRMPLHSTSTPKLKIIEDKRLVFATKPAIVEKRPVDRRAVITKENKEPKVIKDSKNNNIVTAREDKDTKEQKDNKEKEMKEQKDNKEKEIKDNKGKEMKEQKDSKEKEIKEIKDKEKEIIKAVIKNGASDKSINIEESIRRSSRSFKIKDYAKMIRDHSSDADSEDNNPSDIKDKEIQGKSKKIIMKTTTPTKQSPLVWTPTTSSIKKRGRPRKSSSIVKDDVPSKIKRLDDNDDLEMSQDRGSIENNEEKEDNLKTPKDDKTQNEDVIMPENPVQTNLVNNTSSAVSPLKSTLAPSPNVVLSPTGQTLKQVTSLPPGIKPIPLPGDGAPQCEMQLIGKKLVKVQRIVLTKAEVEAMTKKGLVEVKDGTMVLKQGIKLPASSYQMPSTDENAKTISPKKEKVLPHDAS